jgi:hypothetical protein
MPRRKRLSKNQMGLEPMHEMRALEQAKLRRATRYYFGGVAELTDAESGQMMVALVRALNLYGCFVKTDQSFKLVSKLMLKMTH